MVRPKKIVKKMENKKNEHIKYGEKDLIVFSGSAYRQIEKQEDKKMGILMESIDFNECLKKKKELEKEAETTTPEEVKDEKVEENKNQIRLK